MSDSWADRLSEYIDDELTTDERRRVDSHLNECAECRTTLSELRGVVARAASLAPMAPHGDLWEGVASQIAPASAAGVASMPGRTSRRISFTLPQLIAAGLALMVLSGGAVWVAQHGGPATELQSVSASGGSGPDLQPTSVLMPDPHYEEAIADLERTLQNERSSLDQQTVAVIERNLRAIDRAIDQSRRALEQDPANIYLNNHLAETRQQKLLLLRRATAIAAAKGS